MIVPVCGCAVFAVVYGLTATGLVVVVVGLCVVFAVGAGGIAVVGGGVAHTGEVGVAVVVGGRSVHFGVVVDIGSGIDYLCSMLSWAVGDVGDVVVVVVVVVVEGNVAVAVRIVEGWEGIVVCDSFGSCYVGGLVVRAGRWRGRRWLRCLGSDLTILGCG